MLPGSDPWAMFLIETVQPVRTWFIFTSARIRSQNSPQKQPPSNVFMPDPGCEGWSLKKRQELCQPAQPSENRQKKAGTGKNWVEKADGLRHWHVKSHNLLEDQL